VRRVFLLLILTIFSLSTFAELKVAATIYPLYDLVRNIGGDRVKVEVLIPPSQNPHLFEFTPHRLVTLKDARIIFFIGHGLDNWVLKVQDVLPQVRTVQVDEGVSLIGEGREYNPHYWLSIPSVLRIVETIKKELVKEDPGNKSYYEKRYLDYREKLKRLQGELGDLLKGISSRYLVTYHDAWVYFARSFNLKILGVIDPSGTGGLAPRRIREIFEEMKKKGIHTLFVEPAVNISRLRPWLERYGVRVFVLDPLGGVEGRRTYIELMRFNVSQVKRGLGE